MNALTKIGVSTAAFVALALTLGLTGVLPESVWPFRGEEAAPLAARPESTAEARLPGGEFLLRVGPDGAFRFERLTPGPWILSAAGEEIVPGRTSTSTSDVSKPVVLDWTCTVRAGETSFCDLVLGDAEACVLHGRLLIDDAPPGPWQAFLVAEGELFDSEPQASATLDPEGRFRLAVAEPGSYQLVVASTVEGPGMQFVLDVVRLRAGEASWEQALETGTLVLTHAPEWDGEGVPAAIHLWSGAGKLRALAVLAGDEAGELRLPVPAGPSRIVRPDAEARDFDRWPTLVELDVPRGGELLARLP